MTTSDEIRALAKQGLSVAEITRRLDLRYQHVYGVLKKSSSDPVGVGLKPPLSVDELTGGGFELAGRWNMTDAGEITLNRPFGNAIGVYAFAMDGMAVYVGVATMGLAARLAHYGRPGSGQRTNLRLNHLIKTELVTRPFLDIYTAVPGDIEWNGLPVSVSADLEFGLIRKYALPWNLRSAR